MSAVTQRVRSTMSTAWESAPKLRLAPQKAVAAPRSPFILVVIVIVGVGLAGLIFISTVLQRQAFAIAELDVIIGDLTYETQAIERDLERIQSPSGLGAEALRLGMVPNTNPVFLRLEDGVIIGNPVPSEARTNLRGVR